VSADLEHALRSNAADLLAYFERRTHDAADAADALAETMLQAWRRAKDLPTEAERQRMWLFTAAAHTLANQRRSSRRRTALTERLRATMTAPTVPDHAEATSVRDAVLRLRDAQRELVMLVHWDGFTIVEAAELLGLNPSTARGRYAAAREALKQALVDQAHA
jgi:RNA polymerase sigma-70 factor, ECF subfamily